MLAVRRRAHTNTRGGRPGVRSEAAANGIVEVTDVEHILDVRWRVLRPGRPRETASFANDADPRARHFAFRMDDRVVGCASILPAPLTADPRFAWQLRGMAVDADLQRGGVGRQLLTAISETVREPLWCNARLSAAPFYARNGWRPVSAVFDIPGVGPHRRMVHGGFGGADDEIIGEGRHLRLLRRRGWEVAERRKVTGVVGIVALTDDDELIFVEQPRVPVGRQVIELPAGLAGDLADAADEPMIAAARRELFEETGFSGGNWTHVMYGPASAGLTSECMDLFVARGVQQTGPGGGDDTEDIVHHKVRRADAQAWIAARAAEGLMVDTKVLTALWLVGVPWDGTVFVG